MTIRILKMREHDLIGECEDSNWRKRIRPGVVFKYLSI